MAREEVEEELECCCCFCFLSVARFPLLGVAEEDL